MITNKKREIQFLVNDLAARHPEKVDSLSGVWNEMASAQNVFPSPVIKRNRRSMAKKRMDEQKDSGAVSDKVYATAIDNEMIPYNSYSVRSCMRRPVCRCFGLLVLMFLGGCNSSPAQHKAAHDLLLADPHIFFNDGLFYLYGTGASQGFRVYISRDLRRWEDAGMALKRGDSFGDAGFWAPQVFLFKDTFYMAYTANEYIAIASGEGPLGPFTQNPAAALKAPVKQIDPYVFIDDDGKKYLYHVRVANGGNRIFAAEINDDFSAIDESTLRQCISATEQWENMANDKWSVTEGPTVLKHKGLYYLIYSANHFRSPDYAVGYAVSDQPDGPWKKYEGNPILSRKYTGVNGTGHGDLLVDGKDRMYYVFHTHQSNVEVGPRRTAMVRMRFTENRTTGIDKLEVVKGSFYFLK